MDKGDRQMVFEKTHMQNEQKAIVSNFSIFLLISFYDEDDTTVNTVFFQYLCQERKYRLFL
jgi:hypothetical protein